MTADLPLTHVHRPPETDTDGPAPAVVVAHGRGADEEDLLPLASALPDDLHVVSLRGPDRLGPGYTWYELDLSAGGLHASQPDADDFCRSLDLFADSVDAAVEAYDIDPDRVGLLGFSQGAITSLSAMVERPDAYAWVVALHGYLAAAHDDPERLAACAGTPVFVGAGESDEIIPVERARHAAEALADAGVDVTVRTYAVGHGIGHEERGDVAEWVGQRLSP